MHFTFLYDLVVMTTIYCHHDVLLCTKRDTYVRDLIKYINENLLNT